MMTDAIVSPQTVAWTGCVGILCAFVTILYALEPANVKSLHRDHPRKILYRMKMTSVVSVVSILIVAAFGNEGDALPLAKMLGFRMDETFFAGAFIPLLLTASLFLAPIVERAILISCSYGVSNRRASACEILTDFVLFSTPHDTYVPHRNLIVAPFIEELVFRCCMCSLLRLADVSTSKIIFVSPLLFGFAHMHHAVDRILRLGEGVRVSLLRALFQTLYTSLFGAYAAFIFLRTGNVAGPVLSHMFCNSMGFPGFQWLTRPPSDPSHPLRRWRNLLSALLFIGVSGFIAGIVILARTSAPALFRSPHWDEGV